MHKLSSSFNQSVTVYLPEYLFVFTRLNSVPFMCCSDTVSRVGVFCSVVNAIEMCKTEGVVDVFQVVKALRIQKPGAVSTVVTIQYYNCVLYIMFIKVSR